MFLCMQHRRLFDFGHRLAIMRVVVFLVLAMYVVGTSAHGYLSKPRSRNYLHSSNNCPHCLNAGGPQKTSRFGHGMCGDPADRPREHEAGGRFATGKVTGYYRQGGRIRLTTSIATDHRGLIQYRVCRYRAGSPAAERRALTEACLNKHILRRVKGSGRYVYLGNGPERGYNPPKPVTAIFRLPKDLACDGRRWKCVLQMHWVSGNTCSPPQIPRKYSVAGLQTCGASAPAPEEFWNCADIVILHK
jgi:Lytic polysaccharide mono-oxygenase, cellulose-degrading